MIFKFRLIIVLILVLTFVQCSDQHSRRLPGHSGRSGEVIVVMDGNPWTGSPGDSLRSVMETAYPMLPQIEPSFTLLHFLPSQMSDMLRKHRNIISVVIGPDSEGENKVSVQRDKWSNDQLYIRILAADDSNFYNLLNTEGAKINSLLNRTEIERIQSQYRAYPNEDLIAHVKKKFGVSLDLQGEFKIAVEADDFIWLRRERVKYLSNTPHDITQGIFVFDYPYTSDTALTQSAAMAVRDSMLKQYVEGPKKGTYMTTEYRVPPESEVINLNDRYTLLTGGLWKTQNYFMGGPFISLTTLSNDNRRVVSVSGFVFAPKFDKREYIREIEAILLSTKFVENEE